MDTYTFMQIKQQSRTMRTLFFVVSFFMFQSIVFIIGDILQREYYDSKNHCHIPYFEAYSLWYNMYWIESRFMQSISASLIALILMWRPKISRVEMDTIDYTRQERERKSSYSNVSESAFPSNQTGNRDSLIDGDLSVSETNIMINKQLLIEGQGNRQTISAAPKEMDFERRQTKRGTLYHTNKDKFEE